jgi:hypothetical protein
MELLPSDVVDKLKPQRVAKQPTATEGEPEP